MKKTALFITIILAAFLACGLPSVSADAAADLTKAATVTSSTIKTLNRIFDSSVTTYCEWKEIDEINITMPEGQMGGYIYLQWFSEPAPYMILYKTPAGEEKILTSDGGMLHEGFTAPEGFGSARIIVKNGFKLSTLKIYSEGDKPENFQDWLPTVDQADLMVIAAHPDDDILFMGGTIPYYTGQLKKSTVVIYMSHQMRLRQTEALNGLWVMGLKTYPVFAGFPDKYSRSLAVAEQYWAPDDVISYMVEQIRRFKPKVIVTHDVNGEYGHGAHMLVAECIQQAVVAAADETQYPDSAEKYGVHTVSKLYLHLYAENKVTMDWRQPLSAFNGKTALEIATLAYEEHVSQHQYSFSVKDTGRTSCAEFGLAYTTVGNDTGLNDFFENVKEDIEIEPLPSPSPEAIVPVANPDQKMNWKPYVLASFLLLFAAAAVIVSIKIIKKRPEQGPHKKWKKRVGKTRRHFR